MERMIQLILAMCPLASRKVHMNTIGYKFQDTVATTKMFISANDQLIKISLTVEQLSS